MGLIPCIKCQGEGCEACEGSGNHTCDTRGCTEIAVGFNDDGEALCENCLADWVITNYAD